MAAHVVLEHSAEPLYDKKMDMQPNGSRHRSHTHPIITECSAGPVASRCTSDAYEQRDATASRAPKNYGMGVVQLPDIRSTASVVAMPHEVYGLPGG